MIFPELLNETLSSLFSSSVFDPLPFFGLASSTLSFVERLRLFALRVSGLRPFSRNEPSNTPLLYSRAALPPL